MMCPFTGIERMAALTENPFAVLSFIAAPAIMTNASSVLVLSTSNRLARVVERTRQVVARLETSGPSGAKTGMDLTRLERRGNLLRRSLTAFYLSLGSFAFASLISIFGAGAATLDLRSVVQGLLCVALVAGSIAVGSLVYGCTLLVHETRIALTNLSEEGEEVRKHLARV